MWPLRGSRSRTNGLYRRKAKVDKRTKYFERYLVCMGDSIEPDRLVNQEDPLDAVRMRDFAVRTLFSRCPLRIGRCLRESGSLRGLVRWLGMRTAAKCDHWT